MFLKLWLERILRNFGAEKICEKSKVDFRGDDFLIADFVLFCHSKFFYLGRVIANNFIA